MQYEKNFFTSPTALKEYLIDKGFVFILNETTNNTEMRWGQADQDSICHWRWDEGGGVQNFVDSGGEEVFFYSLCSFPGRSIGGLYVDYNVTGVIFCPLKNNGCLLQFNTYFVGQDTNEEALTDPDVMDAVAERLITQSGVKDMFTLNCAFPKRYTIQKKNQIIQNGLVACTPAEQDDRWRYSWRQQQQGLYPGFEPPSFQWIIDNGLRSNLCQIPSVQRWGIQFSTGLNKVALIQGFLSENIYSQVMGENQFPGLIFTINGQRFITLCSEPITEQYYFYIDGNGQQQTDLDSPTRDAPLYRPVAFLLPDEASEVNDHTSTQEYSNITKYKIGDYCIYQGLLYKCIYDIDTPEEWDSSHWQLTTVSQELLQD